MQDQPTQQELMGLILHLVQSPQLAVVVAALTDKMAQTAVLVAAARIKTDPLVLEQLDRVITAVMARQQASLAAAAVVRGPLELVALLLAMVAMVCSLPSQEPQRTTQVVVVGHAEQPPQDKVA